MAAPADTADCCVFPAMRNNAGCLRQINIGNDLPLKTLPAVHLAVRLRVERNPDQTDVAGLREHFSFSPVLSLVPGVLTLQVKQPGWKTEPESLTSFPSTGWQHLLHTARLF